MLKVTCLMFGKSSIGLLGLILFVLACSKDDTIPYSDAPEITLLGVSHDTIIQYDTAVIISIEYKDGDGDIGYESPDKYALFVRDTRLANFDGFYIGPVAPPGVKVPISGKIDIQFPNLFIFGNGSSEKTQFEIKMVDRAGHQSNSLMTDPVVILRD